MHLLVALTLAGLGPVAGSGCGRSRQEQDPPDGGCTAGRGRKPSWLVLRGASDASAAVAVDERTLIVADDENNVLRGFIVSLDLGKTWAQYDLKEFGRRSPCRFHRKNRDGWSRVDLRSGWVTPAEMMFIKPKQAADGDGRRGAMIVSSLRRKLQVWAHDIQPEP